MNYSCEKEKEFAVPTIYILDTVSVCKLLQSIIYEKNSHPHIPEILHNSSLVIPMGVYHKIINSCELPFFTLSSSGHYLAQDELQRVVNFLKKLYTDATGLNSTLSNSYKICDIHEDYSLNFVFHTNVIGIFDTADYIESFYPSSRVAIVTDCLTPPNNYCPANYHFIAYDTPYVPVKHPYSSFDL